MDDFDLFSQPAPVTRIPEAENKNIQEDDLFGSGSLENTSNIPPTNTSSNDQQEDLSWELTDTTTSQSNILGDDTLNDFASTPQVASLDDNDVFTNQSNTNELDSYSTTDSSPAIDDVLYSNQARQQSEDTSSFDMFSNPLSSTPITNTNQPISMGTSSMEDSSPLQAFNARRQQQIAEKDAEEQRKIDELRKQAKNDLDRWYQDRHMHMEQQRQTIKNEEDVFRTKALEQSDRNSCDWSKVIRLLDFSQGAQLSKSKRDLNRMKSTIMRATRDKIKRTSENGV